MDPDPQIGAPERITLVWGHGASGVEPPGTLAPPLQLWWNAVLLAPLFRLLIGLAVALSSLLLIDSAAHGADSKPVVLIGSAGGAVPDTATAAGVAQAALGSGDFQLGGALDAVLALDSSPVWVLGARQQGCSGPPMSTEDFSALLNEASDAVDMLEFGEAHSKLGEAQQAMPCLSAPADPEALYQIWFLAGLSAFHEGKEAEASAAFASAAVLDPTRKWNPDYAPAAQGLFLDALQGALARKAPPLGRDSSLVGVLLVDGRPHDGTGELLVGRHLVQLKTEEGIGGALVTLPEESGWLAALPPATLIRKILEADPAVAGFLGAALAETGWTELVLVSELGAARFDVPNSRYLSQPGLASSTDPVSRRDTSRAGAKAPPGAVAGALVSGIGAGAAGAGFTISGLAWQRGSAAEQAGAQSDYASAYQDNLGGFAMGVAGAVAAGTGLIVALVSAGQRSNGKGVTAQRVRALERRRASLETP